MIGALHVAAEAAAEDSFARRSTEGLIGDGGWREASFESEGRCRAAALAAARAEYRLAKRRAALLGAGIFWDPAWNIMLDVFISDCGAKRLSVTAVCLGSGVPIATATRYVRALIAAGLVSRMADEDDGRRTYVILTEKGRSAMVTLLAGSG